MAELLPLKVYPFILSWALPTVPFGVCKQSRHRSAFASEQRVDQSCSRFV